VLLDEFGFSSSFLLDDEIGESLLLDDEELIISLFVELFEFTVLSIIVDVELTDDSTFVDEILFN
jgi:hypothetical protein